MSSPLWPHTVGGMTAHIENLSSTEYLPVFARLLNTIDRRMSDERNKSAYEEQLDGASVPLNHPLLLDTFDAVLDGAIGELCQRLAYYTYTEGLDEMDIERAAKSAITQAGGSYACDKISTSIITPDGWRVVYPEPASY